MRNTEIAFTRKRRTCIKTDEPVGPLGRVAPGPQVAPPLPPLLPGQFHVAGLPLQECLQDRTSFGVFAHPTAATSSHMGVNQLAGLFLPNTWLRRGVGAVLERGLP